jgi:uncharacterized membrane protein YraQ (UPF0718 family)
MELFAAGTRQDLNAEAFKTGMLFGQMVAMILCGIIPLVQGIKSRQPLMGLMAAFLTASGAWFTGCLGGLPLAVLFSMLIRLFAVPVSDESLRAEVERQREKGWRVS